MVTTLKRRGFRAERDFRNEKIGFKIREAEKAKVPYMLVVGDKEVQSGTVVSSRQKRRQSRKHAESPACSMSCAARSSCQPVKLQLQRGEPSSLNYE